MAYDRTYWLDHVEDQDGTVIQQGTLMDQQHFNKMEEGISNNNLVNAILLFKSLQEGYDTLSEIHVVDLTMAASPWPFNNVDTTVALSQLRETLNYSVDIEVLSYSGGNLGNFEIIDRAKNGFKIRHDGSATAVKVAVRITGGMLG